MFPWKRRADVVRQSRRSSTDPANQTIFITHGDCIEDVVLLESEIKKRLGCTEFVVNYVDPVIGAHSGPGTLALFFVGEHK